MDFIIGLPMIVRQHGFIIVAVDMISKASHFVLVKSTHKIGDIAKIFMRAIFIFHGLPKAIVSNKDAKFTSNFWKGSFQEMGTQLNFSIAYNLQTDGQTKRVN